MGQYTFRIHLWRQGTYLAIKFLTFSPHNIHRCNINKIWYILCNNIITKLLLPKIL